MYLGSFYPASKPRAICPVAKMPNSLHGHLPLFNEQNAELSGVSGCLQRRFAFPGALVVTWGCSPERRGAGEGGFCVGSFPSFLLLECSCGGDCRSSHWGPWGQKPCVAGGQGERERKGLVLHHSVVPPQPWVTPSPGCPPSAGTPRVAKLSLDYRLRNRRDQPPASNPVHPRCQLLTLPPRHPQPIPHTAQKHRNQSASPLGLECKPFLWLLINPKEVRTPHGGCQAPALPNPSPTGPNTADTRTLPALSPPRPQD